MQHERSSVIAEQLIHYLFVARGSERRDHQGLRLATGEKSRSVRAGQQPEVARYRPDVSGSAAVGPLFFIEEHLAKKLLFEALEGVLDVFSFLVVGIGKLFEHDGANLVEFFLALELVRYFENFMELRSRK